MYPGFQLQCANSHAARGANPWALIALVALSLPLLDVACINRINCSDPTVVVGSVNDFSANDLHLGRWTVSSADGAVFSLTDENGNTLVDSNNVPAAHVSNSIVISVHLFLHAEAPGTVEILCDREPEDHAYAPAHCFVTVVPASENGNGRTNENENGSNASNANDAAHPPPNSANSNDNSPNENENGSQTGNANENDNGANDNSANGNGNANSDANQNANTNGNHNANGNANHNGNANQNGNSNSNANANANGNSNANTPPDFTDIHDELTLVFNNPVASSAKAVNEAGLVVGEVTATDGPHAFSWRAGTHDVLDLGFGRATGVNETELIVGFVDDPITGTHAVIYPGAVELAELDGTSSATFGVNDNGVIVGFADMIDMNVDPPVERRHACTWISGNVVDINDRIGLENSVATAINSSGVIVGYAWDGDNPTLSRPFVVATGSATFLDITGFTGGRANAINEFGDVAGTLWNQNRNQLNGATLWSGAGRTSLEASQPTVASAALGINLASIVCGSVGGVAYVWDGQGHAVELTPFFPVPSFGVCNAVSDGQLAVGQRNAASGGPLRAFALQGHF